MAIILCPECGKQISDRAAACPECGYPISTEAATQENIKEENTEIMQKNIINARRAKTKEAWNEVEKYYKLVEQADPDNIEAIFYGAYAAVRIARTTGGYENVTAAHKTAINCFNFLKEAQGRMDVQAFDVLVKQFYDDLRDLVKTGIEGVYKAKKVTLDLDLIFGFTKVVEECYAKEESTVLLQILFDSYHYLDLNWSLAKIFSDFYYPPGQVFNEKLNTFKSELRQIDPSLVPEDPPKASGCYVATAVYGSYDCPQVWTLRRYRDYTLAKTLYGRAFIHTYYAISPTLVKWFGKTQWFKKLWKPLLDHMVNKLRDQGVENKPYNDINW